jgi:hypothetical protein
VLREMLVHLEHGYLLFPKHRPQLVVRDNLALVPWILQIVLLDVILALLIHRGAWKGAAGVA